MISNCHVGLAIGIPMYAFLAHEDIGMPFVGIPLFEELFVLLMFFVESFGFC
jgi:hypothetical protein